MSDAFVFVRRQPADYRIAKYPLSSFENPHWDEVSGGVQTTLFNQSFIYGYVWCDGMIEGELAHSGQLGIENHGPCPHRIKVCALKKDNESQYNTLLAIVGPRPRYERSKPTTGNTCKKDILLVLSDSKESRGTIIIDKLLKIGHGYSNIKALLKRLDREDLIVSGSDPEDNRFNYYYDKEYWESVVLPSIKAKRNNSTSASSK